MGNTPKKGNGHYSLAQYQAKAERTPFELDVDTDRTIVIQPPSADQMFKLERALDSEEGVKIVCGDAADEVLDLFRPLPAEVFEAFSDDLKKHFGLGESDASSA